MQQSVDEPHERGLGLRALISGNAGPLVINGRVAGMSMGGSLGILDFAYWYAIMVG